MELPLGAGAESFEPTTENVNSQKEELEADCNVTRQKVAVKIQQPQKSELEKADKAIRRAARVLELIVAGQIKGNECEDYRFYMESITRHGPGIIISFIQLGLDVFKVHEFYTGTERAASEAAIELRDFLMVESDYALLKTCQQKTSERT